MSQPETLLREDELITALGVCADEHDKECAETQDHAEGCPESRCYANRVHLVAALILEMGLDIEDIGFVAEAILDIQSEPDVPAEAEPDVLDAKELNL